MSWHWSGISLLLVAGAGYLTACAVYVWRYRRGPTAASLVVVLAALAQWGVVRAGALAAGDPAIKRVFCDLKYVGLVVLAPAAIVFVLQYAGFLRRPRPVLLGLLALEPVVSWWCWRSRRPATCSRPACRRRRPALPRWCGMGRCSGSTSSTSTRRRGCAWP